jgi:hypothetical protein
MSASLETVVVARSNQVSARAGDDLVILDLDTSMYYSLDEVGARIFELCREPVTLASVLDAVVDEFEVDAATARADLVALVDTLIAEKLLDAPGSARQANDDG